jgi:hypothetical protein
MLATIQSRTFCVHVCCLKEKNQNIQNYNCALVLDGCETWFLTLRQEHSLRLFEIRVLRRLFGLKSDEVTKGRRKLHNEELHSLYSSPSIISMTKSKRMRGAEHVA